ncbi:hypothetical protein ACOKM5_25190 [Streptomyces sp. BH097]|uniref:hypothetical protein n=1 Tax=Streptomyces sp. BH097 TaxID=3410406 RepID=UPI003CE8DF19
MAEEKRRRAKSIHKDCTHPDTKAARRRCRNAQPHIHCDHGDDPKAMAWCTRRRNQTPEEERVVTMSMGDLLNLVARRVAEENGLDIEVPDFTATSK